MAGRSDAEEQHVPSGGTPADFRWPNLRIPGFRLLLPRESSVTQDFSRNTPWEDLVYALEEAAKALVTQVATRGTVPGAVRQSLTVALPPALDRTPWTPWTTCREDASTNTRVSAELFLVCDETWQVAQPLGLVRLFGVPAYWLLRLTPALSSYRDWIQAAVGALFFVATTCLQTDQDQPGESARVLWQSRGAGRQCMTPDCTSDVETGPRRKCTTLNKRNGSTHSVESTEPQDRKHCTSVSMTMMPTAVFVETSATMTEAATEYRGLGIGDGFALRHYEMRVLSTPPANIEDLESLLAFFRQHIVTSSLSPGATETNRSITQERLEIALTYEVVLEPEAVESEGLVTSPLVDADALRLALMLRWPLRSLAAYESMDLLDAPEWILWLPSESLDAEPMSSMPRKVMSVPHWTQMRLLRQLVRRLVQLIRILRSVSISDTEQSLDPEQPSRVFTSRHLICPLLEALRACVDDALIANSWPKGLHSENDGTVAAELRVTLESLNRLASANLQKSTPEATPLDAAVASVESQRVPVESTCPAARNRGAVASEKSAGAQAPSATPVYALNAGIRGEAGAVALEQTAVAFASDAFGSQAYTVRVPGRALGSVSPGQGVASASLPSPEPAPVPSRPGHLQTAGTRKQLHGAASEHAVKSDPEALGQAEVDSDAQMPVAADDTSTEGIFSVENDPHRCASLYDANPGANGTPTGNATAKAEASFFPDDSEPSRQQWQRLLEFGAMQCVRALWQAICCQSSFERQYVTRFRRCFESTAAACAALFQSSVPETGVLGAHLQHSMDEIDQLLTLWVHVQLLRRVFQDRMELLDELLQHGQLTLPGPYASPTAAPVQTALLEYLTRSIFDLDEAAVLETPHMREYVLEARTEDNEERARLLYRLAGEHCVLATVHDSN